jgi:hypothetical protein
MLTTHDYKIRIKPTDLMSSPSGCLEATRVSLRYLQTLTKDQETLDS